jgi:hypothetical protein
MVRGIGCSQTVHRQVENTFISLCKLRPYVVPICSGDILHSVVIFLVLAKYEKNLEPTVQKSTYICSAFHSDQLMRNPDGGGEVNIQLHLDQRIL